MVSTLVPSHSTTSSQTNESARFVLVCGVLYKHFDLRPGVGARFVSSYFLCLFLLLLLQHISCVLKNGSINQHGLVYVGMCVRIEQRKKRNPHDFKTAAALSDNAPLSPEKHKNSSIHMVAWSPSPLDDARMREIRVSSWPLDSPHPAHGTMQRSKRS